MFRRSAVFGTIPERMVRVTGSGLALAALLGAGSPAVADSRSDRFDDVCSIFGRDFKLNYSIAPIESDIQTDELTTITIGNGRTSGHCGVGVIIQDSGGTKQESVSFRVGPGETFRVCTRDPNIGPDDVIIRSLDDDYDERRSSGSRQDFGCSESGTFDLEDGLFAGTALICTQSRCMAEHPTDRRAQGIRVDASNDAMETVEYADGSYGRRRGAWRRCTITFAGFGNFGD